MKPWTGRIRVGRRISHGETLEVLGAKIIFVNPGLEYETRDREATVEIGGRARDIAARLARKLRALGVHAHRRGRSIVLRREPPAIYAGERRLPVILSP
jgi:hypothetical protein